MMDNYTIALVKELRKRTGVGIIECKKALVNACGDIEIAVDNMRKLGQAKAVEKVNHVTTEGIILSKITQDCKCGVIIELNCETDFVAKGDNLKIFGNEIIDTALDEHITDIKALQARFEKQRTALIARISENISIRRFSVLTGNMLGSYMHGTRIGVIVSISHAASKELIKHLAMHIAASKPDYINACDIPDDVVTREYQIQLDIVNSFGKSREITKKILEDRMYKFASKTSLINQEFIMNQSKTIGQLLNEHNTKVNNFIRLEVGEDIKKAKGKSVT